MMSLQMPERCYCADVVSSLFRLLFFLFWSSLTLEMCYLIFVHFWQVYPMAVVATAERGLIVYQLENQPSEFRRIDSPLKHQVSLPTFCHWGLKYFYLKYSRFNENLSSVLQHRCVAIFKDKQNKPTGFALGSIEGRVAIHYINPPNPWVSAPIRMIYLHRYDFFTPKSPCQGMLLIEFSVPAQRQRQFYLQVPPVQWNQHNHATRHLRCRFTSFFFICTTLLNI